VEEPALIQLSRRRRNRNGTSSPAELNACKTSFDFSTDTRSSAAISGDVGFTIAVIIIELERFYRNAGAECAADRPLCRCLDTDALTRRAKDGNGCRRRQNRIACAACGAAGDALTTSE